MCVLRSALFLMVSQFRWLMIRDFIVEFKDGFWNSFQGFLVLHKLDKPPQNVVAATQPRASSAEPNPSK